MEDNVGSGKLPESFPNPFRVGDYGTGAPPKTSLEQSLTALSQAIRTKADWHKKYKDPEIAQKWLAEALSQGATQEMFEYVMSELDWYASQRDGLIEPATVDGVYQADGLIPASLHSALVQHVSVLESIPEQDRDWHPGTNDQVWDLVHPSLFCYVRGISKKTSDQVKPALKGMGCGMVENTVSISPRNRQDYSISNKFQWLPSDVSVSADGQVSIDSYINNLHPREHSKLYPILGQIFSLFVPLFNRVLTDLRGYPRENRIDVNCDWYPPEPDTDDDAVLDEWHETKNVIQPPVPKFSPRLPPAPFDLRGRNLQVIFKLANIELTPEKPTYTGGTWHVEGMKNECIVASGIYYYVSENITESRLSFREAVHEPDYEQNDDRGVRQMYGLVNDGPLNQLLGDVITQQDRCIAFPNVLQHAVQPFKLADPSKPGHRKILVFFLVDPTQRVLSTANVPPQQREWFAAELCKILPFPKEITNYIVSFLDWPMSLTDAKVYRGQLMNERKYFINENNEMFFERPFSLCEH